MIQSKLILWIGLLSVMDTQEIQDGCRQVRMKEEAVCEDKEVKECGQCHTTHTKECTIKFKEVWTPVRYKRCKVGTNRTRKCVDGVERFCTVR